MKYEGRLLYLNNFRAGNQCKDQVTTVNHGALHRRCIMQEMARHSQLREREVTEIREHLTHDPANLELANKYWTALAGGKSESDLRCGRDVIEAFRAAALKSLEGVVAFACAYRELFEISGESPRKAYFDESLVQALKNSLSELSEPQRSTVQWILKSIDAWPSP